MVKKVFSAVMICVIMMLALTTVSTAQSGVTEASKIKIVIDGKLGTYDDVPLIVDGRTMLPLRTLLVNLGVQNDNEHIIWNATDRSVTIIKDDKNIVLRVNSTTAQVNSTAVTLDAAPLIYKDRTYIPAKFVAQSLGKKVVWDGKAEMVLIRDEAEFYKIKEVLQSIIDAQKGVRSVKYNMNMKVITAATAPTGFKDFSAVTEYVHTDKIMHMGINYGGIETEAYIKDKAVYLKNPLKGDWSKSEAASGIDENTPLSGQTLITDTLCAGLVLDESEPGKLILEGDVILPELLDSYLIKSTIGKTTMKKYTTKIICDKSTRLLQSESVIMTLDVLLKGKTDPESVQLDYSVNFTDINADFSIVIPEAVLNS